MAERATADRVASDMRPPNFRGAVQRLRTIKPKKEKIAGINGEISGIYDTVEGFKVNKKAAKIFLALDGLEPDEKQDIFRSLTGLIQAAQWQIGDLVDQAEGAAAGNIVTPNFGRRDQPADSDTDAELDQTLAEVEAQPETEQPPAAQDEKPKRETPAQKRERIKAAHQAGEAPQAKPEPEPYTGDNSDLNPE